MRAVRMAAVTDAFRQGCPLTMAIYLWFPADSCCTRAPCRYATAECRAHSLTCTTAPQVSAGISEAKTTCKVMLFNDVLLWTRIAKGGALKYGARRDGGSSRHCAVTHLRRRDEEGHVVLDHRTKNERIGTEIVRVECDGVGNLFTSKDNVESEYWHALISDAIAKRRVVFERVVAARQTVTLSEQEKLRKRVAEVRFCAVALGIATHTLTCALCSWRMQCACSASLPLNFARVSLLWLSHACARVTNASPVADARIDVPDHVNALIAASAASPPPAHPRLQKAQSQSGLKFLTVSDAPFVVIATEGTAAFCFREASHHPQSALTPGLRSCTGRGGRARVCLWRDVVCARLWRLFPGPPAGGERLVPAHESVAALR